MRGYFGVPKSPRNPGEFDTREHLRIHGILAEIRVTDPGNMVKLGSGGGNPIVAARLPGAVEGRKNPHRWPR